MKHVQNAPWNVTVYKCYTFELKNETCLELTKEGDRAKT